MKKIVVLLGFVGLILFVYGMLSAILYSNTAWFSYSILGGTLALGFVNYKLNNNSIFSEFKKNKLFVFKLFVFYLLSGVVIEIIGRFLFGLWEYPTFHLIEKIIHVFVIGYPFVFFFIYETFVLFSKKIKNFIFSFILTTLFSAFLYESPNTFAWEWVYKIPYVTFEIFKINVIVILGWTILVAVPLIANRFIR